MACSASMTGRRPARTSCSRAAGGTSYTPVQVGEAYDVPGGGHRRRADGGDPRARRRFHHRRPEHVLRPASAIAAPQVTAVGVDGGANAPGQDTGADGEVMLDIEVIGALAPGAAIVVYFAPNTDQGFLDGLSTAIHDTHPQAIGGLDQLGTVRGQLDRPGAHPDGADPDRSRRPRRHGHGGQRRRRLGRRRHRRPQHADFPASAPHALACGGTSLQISGGQITAEAVWNSSGGGATGGGVSRQFPLPSYQAGAGVPGNVDTKLPGGVSPTSAATPTRLPATGSGPTAATRRSAARAPWRPLWAALIARLNESLGAPVGFVQPRLYPLSGIRRLPRHRQRRQRRLQRGRRVGTRARGWDRPTGPRC